MELIDALSSAEILENALPSTLHILSRFSTLKQFKKGEHLFYDKDEVQTIYIVITGMSALYKVDCQGEKKVIFVFGKGKTLNEVILNYLPASINCEMLKTGQILCIPRDVFLSVMECDFPLTKSVMDSMSIKIRRLYRQMKNTTNSLRGDKKIAAKLWKLSTDYGKPCEDGVCIDLKLTITYLADMLGSKRETVSRQLKILTDSGLVIFHHNRFIIPDREKLLEYFKMP